MKYIIIQSSILTNLGTQIAKKKKKKHALFFYDVPKLSVSIFKYIHTQD